MSMTIGDRQILRTQVGENVIYKQPEWQSLELPDHVTGAAEISQPDEQGYCFLKGTLVIIPVDSAEASNYANAPVLCAPEGYLFNDFIGKKIKPVAAGSVPNIVENQGFYTLKEVCIIDGKLCMSNWSTPNQSTSLFLDATLLGKRGNVFDENDHMVKVQLIKEK